METKNNKDSALLKVWEEEELRRRENWLKSSQCKEMRKLEAYRFASLNEHYEREKIDESSPECCRIDNKERRDAFIRQYNEVLYRDLWGEYFT